MPLQDRVEQVRHSLLHLAARGRLHLLGEHARIVGLGCQGVDLGVAAIRERGLKAEALLEGWVLAHRGRREVQVLFVALCADAGDARRLEEKLWC